MELSAIIQQTLLFFSDVLALLAMIPLILGIMLTARSGRFTYIFFKAATLLLGAGIIIPQILRVENVPDNANISTLLPIFFDALLSILLCYMTYAVLDAFENPQRGLGILWPVVASLSGHLHELAERKSIEGENRSIEGENSVASYQD